jgi:hypothetical protein
LNEIATSSRVASVGGSLVGTEEFEVIVGWPFVEEVCEEASLSINPCVFEHLVKDPTCRPNKRSAEHLFFSARSLPDNRDPTEGLRWMVRLDEH